jgi:hypothetical protein
MCFLAGRANATALMMQLWFNSSLMTAVLSVTSDGIIPIIAA